MIRYKLDDLGWYQFEWLIQSLLKAELGLGVESWGGRRDHGRDAYCTSPLNFPAKHVTTDGPFLFQVKFVENANAAGSKPKAALLDAVAKEASLIKSRRRLPTRAQPKHYVMITNAPCSTEVRRQIETTIRKAMSGATPHCLAGTDVCDLLDKNESLRRSFPQLLSLRDLNQLLTDVINKEILERSSSAVSSAREIIPVFVPTGAYVKAVKALHDHNFVVLEGPPEMGKTAIAWIVAIAQLSMNWEAIVCDSPDDFFKCYEPGNRQVFVADDAFGRTEYDPSRGSKWESQLGHVYGLLNSTHWLVWTSRKHILERALRSMDLQGKVGKFPKPGAVLVDAGQLTTEEKALILYRHGRAAGLETPAKALVREHARLVVLDSSFTPERIRRFIQERLRTLVSETETGHLDKETVAHEIREAIRNPTDRMKKTFRALPLAHKWLLIAILEAGDRPSKDLVARLYQTHCPLEAQRPFEDLTQELAESFIKQVQSLPLQQSGQPIERIDWTHPSYKDLVIDELLSDSFLHMQFMQAMPLEDVKLAISDTGGAAGNRSLPLMTSEASWQLLFERCSKLSKELAPYNAANLLRFLVNAVTSAHSQENKQKLVNILEHVCEECRNKWDEAGVALREYELSAYCEASVLISTLPPMPKLNATWADIVGDVKRALKEYDDANRLEPDSIETWARIVNVIQENEPRFLNQAGFPSKYLTIFTAMNDILTKELSSRDIFDTPDELRYEAYRLRSLAEPFKRLSSFSPAHTYHLSKTADEMEAAAESLNEEANEKQEPEPDYDADSHSGTGDSFDVEALFSDL